MRCPYFCPGCHASTSAFKTLGRPHGENSRLQISQVKRIIYMSARSDPLTAARERRGGGARQHMELSSIAALGDACSSGAV